MAIPPTRRIGVVFSSYARHLQDIVYNYHCSLRASLIEGMPCLIWLQFQVNKYQQDLGHQDFHSRLSWFPLGRKLSGSQNVSRARIKITAQKAKMVVGSHQSLQQETEFPTANLRLWSCTAISFLMRFWGGSWQNVCHNIFLSKPLH